MVSPRKPAGNIDADVVVDGLFGWKDHQFRFGQVQLKVVVFHPCGNISKTVRDPRRDRGVLRRETETAEYHRHNSDRKNHASG